MEFSSYMNSLLTKLIPTEIEVAQKFELEVHVQKAISLSIPNGFQQISAQNLSF